MYCVLLAARVLVHDGMHSGTKFAHTSMHAGSMGSRLVKKQLKRCVHLHGAALPPKKRVRSFAFVITA